METRKKNSIDINDPQNILEGTDKRSNRNFWINLKSCATSFFFRLQSIYHMEKMGSCSSQLFFFLKKILLCICTVYSVVALCSTRTSIHH